MTTPNKLPRIAITYCTQCRWMLRAAYFAQELLSTFSTQIGEIALIPATGGLFTVELTYQPVIDGAGDGTTEQELDVQSVMLWDRKAEGGFPETKVLKQRVRDRIEPSRDLGHSDVGGKRKDAVPAIEPEQSSVVEQKVSESVKAGKTSDVGGQAKRNAGDTVCEDCK